VRNATDAEDLTEQVFLKAWEALPAYQQRGKRFASWLYQIARNLVIDHHRAHKPVQSASLGHHDDVESKQATALERVIEAEESAALATAVSRLPPEQQQVIFLRFVKGLDHAEVARILDKSKGACRVIQHRALTALNQMLGSTFLLVLFMILLVGGGTVYTARNALPDQLLYPVKRMTESVELAVTLRSEDDLSLYLDFADRRLEEATRLIAIDHPMPLAQTFDSYTAHVTSAQALLNSAEQTTSSGQLAISPQLAEAVSGQTVRLAMLKQQLAVDADPSVRTALESAQTANDQVMTTIEQFISQQAPEAPLVPLSASATPNPTPSVTASPVAPMPTMSVPAPITATRLPPTATASPSRTPTVIVVLPSPTATARPVTVAPAPTAPPPPPLPTATPTLVVQPPPQPQPSAWPWPSNWPIPTALPEEFQTAMPTNWPDMVQTPWPTERPGLVQTARATAWPSEWPDTAQTPWSTERPGLVETARATAWPTDVPGAVQTIRPTDIPGLVETAQPPEMPPRPTEWPDVTPPALPTERPNLAETARPPELPPRPTERPNIAETARPSIPRP
jgi:RNA polymerase sigma-70 factor (ECF subfamily)